MFRWTIYLRDPVRISDPLYPAFFYVPPYVSGGIGMCAEGSRKWRNSFAKMASSLCRLVLSFPKYINTSSSFAVYMNPSVLIFRIKKFKRKQSNYVCLISYWINSSLKEISVIEIFQYFLGKRNWGCCKNTILLWAPRSYFYEKFLLYEVIASRNA